MASDPHTHGPVPERSGLTGFAIAKYGFILLIVIASLWFIAYVLIPTFTD